MRERRLWTCALRSNLLPFHRLVRVQTIIPFFTVASDATFHRIHDSVLATGASQCGVLLLISKAFWSESVILSRRQHHNILLVENNLWAERICRRNLGVLCMHTDSKRKCDSYLSHRLWVMFAICIFYIAEKKAFKRILRKQNCMLIINHQEVKRVSVFLSSWLSCSCLGSCPIGTLPSCRAPQLCLGTLMVLSRPLLCIPC